MKTKAASIWLLHHRNIRYCISNLFWSFRKSFGQNSDFELQTFYPTKGVNCHKNVSRFLGNRQKKQCWEKPFVRQYWVHFYAYLTYARQNMLLLNTTGRTLYLQVSGSRHRFSRQDLVEGIPFKVILLPLLNIFVTWRGRQLQSNNRVKTAKIPLNMAWLTVCWYITEILWKTCEKQTNIQMQDFFSSMSYEMTKCKQQPHIRLLLSVVAANVKHVVQLCCDGRRSKGFAFRRKNCRSTWNFTRHSIL